MATAMLALADCPLDDAREPADCTGARIGLGVKQLEPHPGVNVGAEAYERAMIFFLDRPEAVAQPPDG